jgi:hypothetical protein
MFGSDLPYEETDAAPTLVAMMAHLFQVQAAYLLSIVVPMTYLIVTSKAPVMRCFGRRDEMKKTECQKEK